MEILKEKPERLVNLYDEDARVWKLLSKDREPLKSLKIIEDAFLKFGLSINEIRVYIYLARSGSVKHVKFRVLFPFIEPRRIEYYGIWKRED